MKASPEGKAPIGINSRHSGSHHRDDRHHELCPRPKGRQRSLAARFGTKTIASASIFAVWLAAALAWPLSGKVVPWDSKNHFYPMFRFLGRTFADGYFPLWNPYHFSGHPTIADPQSLIFTPTLALFAFLSPKASMFAFDAAVYAHLSDGRPRDRACFACAGASARPRRFSPR